MVEHQAHDARWFCFPGGTLECGEPPEAGVRRELLEELDLACDVGRLVAVGYQLDPTNHSVELYFHCTAAERQLVSRSEAVASARFVEVSELAGLRVCPLELSAALAADPQRVLSQLQYYGRFE